MSLNKNISIKYVWNKMRVLKNRFNTVSWNKWQGKSREEEITKTIEKLAPPWVPESNIGIDREKKTEDIDQETQHMNRQITMEEMESHKKKK